MKPEEEAREQIDQLLAAAGWQVQDLQALNLGAARGVAVREFPLHAVDVIERRFDLQLRTRWLRDVYKSTR